MTIPDFPWMGDSFHLEGLRIERRNDAVWISRSDGSPLKPGETRIGHCILLSDSNEVIIAGPVETLEKSNAPIRILAETTLPKSLQTATKEGR